MKSRSSDRPAKKQKPLSKACEACRARKAKCDGLIPSCEPCIKRNLPCVYREREQPGLRPGFGKSLEQRLSRMEENLDQIRSFLQDSGTGKNGEQFQYNPDRNDESRAAEVAIQQDAPSCPEQNSLSLSPGLNIYTGERTEMDIPEGLPPRHILHELSSLYFEYAHPWMNILDRPAVEASIFNLDSLVALHCITLFGFRYWDRVAPNVDIRLGYMETSRQRLLAAAIDEISATSALALTALALDALGQCPSARALNLVSLLNSATTQLDIADNQTIQSNTGNKQNQAQSQASRDALDHTQNSKLFWTIYTLDRVIAVSHGISCKISPNFFRRECPTDDLNTISTPIRRIEALIHDVRQKTTTPRGTLSEPWQKLVQISTLIERVNEFILSRVDHSNFDQSQAWKSHFRALDTALTAWRDLQLHHDVEGSLDPVETTARAMYHTAVIRMHSVAAFPPRTSPLPTASPLAPGRCYQAVQAICTICTSLHQTQSQPFAHTGPLFAFAVWVAARNIITLWTSSWGWGWESQEEQDPIPPQELTTLLDSLRAMAGYWPCARKFSDMIEFVIEGLPGKRSSNGNNNRNRESMLAVFNDVSLTAYGLQNVLGPRIERDRSERVQMAQLWDWFSVPGLGEGNPFI